MGYRTLRRVGALLIVLLLLVTLATAKGRDGRLYPPKPGEAVTIFLVDNGFHTDLAISRDALLAGGGPLAHAVSQTTKLPWVLIGWGDARFYEDQSPWQGRILDGVRALFGRRPTIVHLEGISLRPDRAWREGVRRIVISRAGLAALLVRANRSFVADAAGGPVADAVPRPPDQAFFRSGEGFSGVHLCNHWTAELLHGAGLPTTPVLDTIPAGLKADLELRARLDGQATRAGALDLQVRRD